MRPTDLAFNQLLGVRDAPPGAPHLLELPWSDGLRNHLGTFHAAAQFALAEAASAECLRRQFPDLATNTPAVVRQVELRYRKAATSGLAAFGRTDDGAAARLRADLASRGHGFIAVDVELRDGAGVTSFAGTFKWYLRRAPAP